MSHTLNGKPFAGTLHTNDINALVFSKESTVIPPFSNAFIKCKMLKVKDKHTLVKHVFLSPLSDLKLSTQAVQLMKV